MMYFFLGLAATHLIAFLLGRRSITSDFSEGYRLGRKQTLRQAIHARWSAPGMTRRVERRWD